ncbi:MAG: hypothetical protein HOP02_16455 [Methylococcaceae bacterium]|nr:hypothetical protein [Methylococcaceae bacterium]
MNENNAAYQHRCVYRYTQVFKLVIPAGMPESSHMDVNLRTGIKPKSSHRGIGKLPSLALDSGIPAGMTCDHIPKPELGNEKVLRLRHD